jgi:hypothetical protein
MKLKLIDVYIDEDIGDNGQILLIEVVTPDIETANNSINSFMGSVMRITDTINSEHGTSIILCHVRIMDREGNVLLDYVKNVDTGSEQWKMANGLKGDWFPHPVPPPSPATPSPTPGEPYPPPPPGDNPPVPPYPQP